MCAYVFLGLDIQREREASTNDFMARQGVVLVLGLTPSLSKLTRPRDGWLFPGTQMWATWWGIFLSMTARYFRRNVCCSSTVDALGLGK